MRAMFSLLLIGCSPSPDAASVEQADACDTPGHICTIAGLPGIAMFSEDGLPAREAALYLPVDATVAPDGTTWVIDWNNHRIRQILADGTMVTRAGTGFLGDGPPGPALDAAFNHPVDIVFDPDRPERVHIAAWHNERLGFIERGQLTWEAGTGAMGWSGDGGLCRDATFALPSSVVFDEDGSRYVMDGCNAVVRKIDIDGTIHTVAGRPPAPAPPAEDALDSGLMTYHRGFAGDGGPASDAELFPMMCGKAAVPGGKMLRLGRELWLADTANHAVRVIDLDTLILHTVAGRLGVPGATGDGGSARDATLNAPADIAADELGRVYVADTDNHCVRRIEVDGTIDTVAGVCGEPGDAMAEDVPATEARLWGPTGVAWDPAGYLVVSDQRNHVVRRVRIVEDSP